MPSPEPAIRPFNLSGYEILDGGFCTTGKVVIWSKAPAVPSLGDYFTIDRRGAIHDLAVAEVRTFKGGWVATCQAC
jgi:hypothetical protein